MVAYSVHMESICTQRSELRRGKKSKYTKIQKSKILYFPFFNFLKEFTSLNFKNQKQIVNIQNVCIHIIHL